MVSVTERIMSNPTPIMGFFVASAASLLFGALFYSNLMFRHTWLKYSVRPMTHEKPTLLELKAFCMNLCVAVTLGLLMGHPETVPAAALRGLLIGGGLVGMSMCHNYLHTAVKPALMILDGSFYALSLSIMASVLQAFRSPSVLSGSGFAMLKSGDRLA